MNRGKNYQDLSEAYKQDRYPFQSSKQQTPSNKMVGQYFKNSNQLNKTLQKHTNSTNNSYLNDSYDPVNKTAIIQQQSKNSGNQSYLQSQGQPKRDNLRNARPKSPFGDNKDRPPRNESNQRNNSQNPVQKLLNELINQQSLNTSTNNISRTSRSTTPVRDLSTDKSNYQQLRNLEKLQNEIRGSSRDKRSQQSYLNTEGNNGMLKNKVSNNMTSAQRLETQYNNLQKNKDILSQQTLQLLKKQNSGNPYVNIGLQYSKNIKSSNSIKDMLHKRESNTPIKTCEDQMSRTGGMPRQYSQQSYMGGIQGKRKINLEINEIFDTYTGQNIIQKQRSVTPKYTNPSMAKLLNQEPYSSRNQSSRSISPYARKKSSNGISSTKNAMQSVKSTSQIPKKNSNKSQNVYPNQYQQQRDRSSSIQSKNESSRKYSQPSQKQSLQDNPYNSQHDPKQIQRKQSKQCALTSQNSVNDYSENQVFLGGSRSSGGGASLQQNLNNLNNSYKDKHQDGIQQFTPQTHLQKVNNKMQQADSNQYLTPTQSQTTVKKTIQKNNQIQQLIQEKARQKEQKRLKMVEQEFQDTDYQLTEKQNKLSKQIQQPQQAMQLAKKFNNYLNQNPNDSQSISRSEYIQSIINKTDIPKMGYLEQLLQQLSKSKQHSEMASICKQYFQSSHELNINNIDQIVGDESKMLQIKKMIIQERIGVALLLTELNNLNGNNAEHGINTNIKTAIQYMHSNFLILLDIIVKQYDFDQSKIILKEQLIESIKEKAKQKKLILNTSIEEKIKQIQNYNDIICPILKLVLQDNGKAKEEPYYAFGIIIDQLPKISLPQCIGMIIQPCQEMRDQLKKLKNIEQQLYHDMQQQMDAYQQQNSNQNNYEDHTSNSNGNQNDYEEDDPDDLPQVFPPFLPPQPQGSKKMYTLVLDLDETLVHFRESMDPDEPGQFLIRPFAEKFLPEMNKYYEIVIFTAALQHYADFILDKLDIEKCIKHRLYRQHCSLQPNNSYAKDLSLLGRSIETTLIVDNLAENFSLQSKNGILIKTWNGDPDDRALKDLTPLLQNIVKSKKINDVRIAMDIYRRKTMENIQMGIQDPHLNVDLDED